MKSAGTSLPEIGRFHDDPNQSYTLPGTYYYDPSVYAAELGAIFSRTWQYVCHVSRLQAAGDYAVRDIGDQSVVVLRSADGQLRAYHNVCRHRAHRLLEGSGQTGTAIVCPYHNWTYRLSGELLSARHSAEVEDFNVEEFCLHGVRVETFCGFVFVNLDDDAEPLLQGLEELEWEIRELSPQLDELKLADYREIPIAANWKNSVENYSECYHCPNRHPSLANGSLDMASYQITVHDRYHSHASRGVGEDTAYGRPMDTHGEAREFGSWLIWPNFVLEVYPGGYLNSFYHLPVAVEQTIQVCEWYFPSEQPTVTQQEVIDFVDGVRDEDIPICESVQKGLHSKGYTQGRFIADSERSYFSEHAVHDFQKRVIRALGMWD